MKKQATATTLLGNLDLEIELSRLLMALYAPTLLDETMQEDLQQVIDFSLLDLYSLSLSD